MKNLKPKKAVYIGTDGDVRDTHCDGLKSIQKAVGGDFEQLFRTKDAVGLVNEMGGYGLPRNVNAERIAARLGVRLHGPVFGPLLLVGPSDRHGNETHCRQAVRRLAYDTVSDAPTDEDGQRGADRLAFTQVVNSRTWVRADGLLIERELLAEFVTRSGVSTQDALAAFHALWRGQAASVLAGYEFGQAEVLPAHPSLTGLVFNFGVIDGLRLVSGHPFYPHRD
jgi:hypothetical protein